MTTGYAVTDPRTVSELLTPLAQVDDRGLYAGGEFTSWRDHLKLGAVRAAAFASLLDADKPRHVGILASNVAEFSFLLSAAVLGDFVLVGLNTTRRGDALHRDIATADCQLVLVTDDTADLLDDVECAVPVVNLDTDEWSQMLAPFHDAPVTFADHRPDDLLMLIFTSGTSGEPKAVRCSHRKLAGAAMMLAHRFGIGARDVCYLAMPMFHSNSVIAGWSVAVAAGASIVLRPKFSARGFVADARRYGVTYANYVGKPLHYILAVDEQSDDAELPLRIMYGNEASAGDRTEFARRFGCTVVDGFGSSEGGVAITRTPETPPSALGPRPANVGICDPDTDEPVPDGTIGEIVNMTGAGLFDGYYGDDDATAQRLRGGKYRTGDLGWIDDAGFIHFAGRVGDWARVDGENIGTAPIEAILVRHPRIAQAVVYGVPGEIGDDLWAALIAPDLTPDELSSFLSAQPDLGPKQWPSAIRLVSEFPHTATFKAVKREVRAAGGAADWRLSGKTYSPSR